MPTSSPIRLLISDSESQLVGGVDTVRRKLIPALARHPQVEKVVWLAPDYILDDYKRMLPTDTDLTALEVVGFLHPPYSWRRWLHTALRRTTASSSRLGRPLATRAKTSLGQSLQRLDRARVEALQREHRSTHMLHIAVLTQPPPTDPRGVAGVIYDMNSPSFGDCDVLKNFTQWLEKAEKIITISESARLQLIELAPHRAERVQTIFLGANPQPSSDCSGKGNREGHLTLGAPPSTGAVFYYPATLNSHKDHLTLLRAAVALAQAGERFRVVLTGGRTDELLGQEPLGSEPTEHARQFYQENRDVLGEHVQALGACPWETVEEQYHSCHCVILPARYEGFGLPFVESLERGVPIICSDIEPFKEQIEHYGCSEPAVRIFPRGDAAALAERMREFMRQPRESEAAAAYSRLKVNSWTWDHVANSYVRVLQSLTPLS